LSRIVKIKGKKYRLPRGWELMTPEWLSRMSGIPLEELIDEETEETRKRSEDAKPLPANPFDPDTPNPLGLSIEKHRRRT